MNIKFKGPTGLIFDVSSLNQMLDEEGVFSPLATQYVVERDLVEKLGLTVISDIPQYPSLREQYSNVRKLMAHHGLEFHTCLPEYIVGMLRMFIISVVMDKEVLIICLQKHLRS